MKTPSIRNSISRSPLRRGFLLIPLALACFALSPIARAVTPAPDGGYPIQNTAEGEDALFSLTTGTDNTANGYEALYFNTTGSYNTANGIAALFSNTIGFFNTANGNEALFSNTTGFENTANGASALFDNRAGSGNTANGVSALTKNRSGSSNTADGYRALSKNKTGSGNTANGSGALVNNTTGDSNIALGDSAGANLTTGSNNIDIAAFGNAGESNTIRIGRSGIQKSAYVQGIYGVTVASGVGVIVGTNGHLGTVVSSERFKDGIKPMDKASEAILALKPVTFRYKEELDPKGIPQFGLVAEQVEKVNPDLVARDDQGKPYTVRYEAVNAMLLNEFLKEHRKVEALESTVAHIKSAETQQKDLQATVAQQQQQIERLTRTLKEQSAQIQKVSDQLELSKTAPRLIVDDQ